MTATLHITGNIICNFAGCNSTSCRVDDRPPFSVVVSAISDVSRVKSLENIHSKSQINCHRIGIRTHVRVLI